MNFKKVQFNVISAYVINYISYPCKFIEFAIPLLAQSTFSLAVDYQERILVLDANGLQSLLLGFSRYVKNDNLLQCMNSEP